MRHLHFILLLTSVFFFLQCTPNGVKKGSIEHLREVTSAIDAAALTDVKVGDWLSYGMNYQEDRHSSLDQINKQNLDKLGLAWSLDLGTKRGIQSTPLIVDGIIFATGPWSVVYAIDARSGKMLWTYDPEVPRANAILNAEDGSVNWDVDTKVEPEMITSITGAPRIAQGRVVIGNGGAEFNARGYVSGYDAKTGDLDWRFFTVPGDPAKPFENPALEEAAKTWTGEWWKQGGGGTVWDAIVYDPKLNTIYIGVGNGAHWDRQIRSPQGGDNLFLSSIVALNADDGTYKWHYQTTPGDTWDYTATQHIILADIEIEGRERQVLMQAPKNGFFYVLDRATGELISADNFAYQNWTTGMGEDGRPVEAPGARYDDGATHYIAPSSLGGHNWHPMTYSHRTGLVYIPTLVESGAYQHMPIVEEGVASKLGAQISLAGKLYIPPVFDPNPAAPQPFQSYGELIAYDPIKQERVWAKKQSLRYNGGLLSTTTGLIMQSDAEGRFSIRDDETGDVLWDYDIRSGGIASPVTYLVDGEQYVTIFVGWGGVVGQAENIAGRLHPGTVYTFKLGGNAEAPATLPEIEKSFTTIKTDANPVNIGEGFNLYEQYCIGCHGNPWFTGGNIPSLMLSSDGVFDAYDDIVLDGLLAEEGMPNFENKISEEELEDIRSFMLYTADAFSNETPLMEYLTAIGGMQYMADQNPPVRKNIE